MNLSTGAFGDPNSIQTLILFWSKMELLHYPGAGETKAYLEEQLRRQQEQAAMQQAQAAAMQQAAATAAQAPPQAASSLPGAGIQKAPII